VTETFAEVSVGISGQLAEEFWKIYAIIAFANRAAIKPAEGGWG
jgi:hypothetical protein